MLIFHEQEDRAGQTMAQQELRDWQEGLIWQQMTPVAQLLGVCIDQLEQSLFGDPVHGLDF